MPKPCSYKVCSRHDCLDFLDCEDIWGALNVSNHPCKGCSAQNHAEKCAKVKPSDCRAMTGK